MKRRISSWFLILLTLIGTALLPAKPVEAATLADINDDGVFLKQTVDGHCTLSSTVMMMRRYALLRGDEDWDTITEDTISPVAWIDVGVRYSFTYAASGGNISVAHDTLPGDSSNKEILISLLEEHPEGIVIYYTGSPHAVLLTDYSYGQFYCADPGFSYPLGRIPLTSSFTVREYNVSAYWYITSPKVEIEEFNPRAEATAKPTVTISDKNVTVSWNEAKNAKSYDVYLTTTPWDRDSIVYQEHVGANRTSFTFTDVEPGDYATYVISRPNGDDVQSAWTYFTVTGSPEDLLSVSTDAETCTVGSTAAFSFNAEGAASVHLYIYCNGTKFFEGQFLSTATYETELPVAGHYTYRIIGHYNYVDVEGEWAHFQVTGNKKTKSKKA